MLADLDTEGKGSLASKAAACALRPPGGPSTALEERAEQSGYHFSLAASLGTEQRADSGEGAGQKVFRPLRAPVPAQPQERRKSPDQCAPPVNSEASSASSARDFETTIAQFLHEATCSLRKEVEAVLSMSSRDVAQQRLSELEALEDRLFRRLNGEMQELTTVVADLRQDVGDSLKLAGVQPDAPALEDRLFRRLNGELQELTTVVADLRQDVGDSLKLAGVQPDAQVRQKLDTLGAAIAELAWKVLPSGGGASNSSCNGEGVPTDRAVAADVANAELRQHGQRDQTELQAAVFELRRRVDGQQEQAQLQAVTWEASLRGLRKQLLALHSEEMCALRDQCVRGAKEMTQNIQEATEEMEASAASVRRELQHEVSRLRSQIALVPLESLKAPLQHSAAVGTADRVSPQAAWQPLQGEDLRGRLEGLVGRVTQALPSLGGAGAPAASSDQHCGQRVPGKNAGLWGGVAGAECNL